MQITGIKLNTSLPQKKTVPKKIVNTSTKVVPQKRAIAPKATPKKALNPKVQIKPLKREETKKVEQKQEVGKEVEEKKVEIIKKQVEQEEIVPEIKQPVIEPFDVVVRYNHYKEKFPCVNGILSFQPIEDKYSFGFVYKGNYLPVLKLFGGQEEIQPETFGSAVEYSWKVQENSTYAIHILEDEEAEAQRERKVYKAPEKPKCCPLKKNAQVEHLTNQMKQMQISELGSEKHRELIEQRNLEEILFS